MFFQVLELETQRWRACLLCRGWCW